MKALISCIPERRAIVLGLALVMGCWLLLAWINVQWGRLDQSLMPPEPDSFKYTLNADRIAREVNLSGRPMSPRLLYWAWKKNPVLSVNVFSMIQAAAAVELGPGRLSEIVSLLPFLLIFVAATVALGWVTLGPAEGILAGLILMCFPGTIGFFRISHIEVPAMALAACLPALAWRASVPGRPLAALVFGAIAGLGLFMRYEFPVYAFPAIIWPALVWLNRFRPRALETNRRAMARALAITVGLACIGFGVVFAIYRSQITGPAASMIKYGIRTGPSAPEYLVPMQFQNAGWLILPIELVRVTMEPAWALLAALCVPLAFIRSKEEKSGAAHLVVTAIVGLAFLGSFENKEARRLLMLLPCIAAATAGGLVALRRRLGPAVTVLIGMFVALGAARAYDLSFVPQGDEGRVFLLEKNVPQAPRPEEPGAERIAATLLRHGTWPLKGRVAIMGSADISTFYFLQARTVIYGLDLTEMNRDPAGGPAVSAMFHYQFGPPDLILGVEPLACGPRMRAEIFDYVKPEELDKLCSSLPPYRVVDKLQDPGGETLYLLKRTNR